jgi:hypothetical protein
MISFPLHPRPQFHFQLVEERVIEVEVEKTVDPQIGIVVDRVRNRTQRKSQDDL